MPYVTIISVGRRVMTWIFSCDLSMKNMLKFVWLIFGFFFFLALLGFTFKCRSGNPVRLDPKLLSSYRLISLLDKIGKWFEKILPTRILSDVSGQGLLHH